MAPSSSPPPSPSIASSATPSPPPSLPSPVASNLYSCSVCSITLSSLGGLRSHMVRRHPLMPRNHRQATAPAAGDPVVATLEPNAGASDPGLACLGPPQNAIQAATTSTPAADEAARRQRHGDVTASPASSSGGASRRAPRVSSARPPRGPMGRSARQAPGRPEIGLAQAAGVADPTLRLLFQASAEVVSRETMGHCRPPPIPSSGKRRRAAARKSTPWYRFGTVCTTARASFERLGDWIRSEPAAVLRPGAKPFLFAGRRLRALRDFVAECGGSGLSMSDQTRLYKLLVMGSWQAREVAAPPPPPAALESATNAAGATGNSGSGNTGGGSVAAHEAGGGGSTDEDAPAHRTGNSTGCALDDVFGSATAFRNAIRDDLDRSIVDAGWRKVELVEGGRSYVAFFRCALAVGLSALLSAKRKQLRRCADAVGGRREHPIDGEAFALHQAEVDKVAAEPSFVLAAHLYSDCTLLSRSGGELTVSMISIADLCERRSIGWCTVPCSSGPLFGGMPENNGGRCAYLQSLVPRFSPFRTGCRSSSPLVSTHLGSALPVPCPNARR